MSADSIPRAPITDPYKFFHLILNSDGTITRSPTALPLSSAEPNSNISQVLSKDIPINHSNKTWARIFLPQQAVATPISSNKLPLLVYFHGGGFILGRPDLAMFHEFCSNIASELQVIVLSASYRLAPEHRLPAAYDDAMEALHWIKTIPDDWLRDFANYSNCFLIGTSAGSNMAYHVGLHVAEEIDHLLPLKIKGLILHQPFFGGVERTESELRLINNPFFPPCVSDLAWELSLPAGVDRDHKYCNPIAGDGFTVLEKIKPVGWRVLVTGYEGDQMIDRQMELVKSMEKIGIQVVGHFSEGGCHGLEFFDSSKASFARCIEKLHFVFNVSLRVCIFGAWPPM